MSKPLSRKLLDEVCKKQGRITQSKELSLLIEYIKHNAFKNNKYSIRGANQICSFKNITNYHHSKVELIKKTI